MHSVQAKHSLRMLSLRQPAQYIWTGFENMGDESDDNACDGMMWKLLPDWFESIDDETASFSTEGNGPKSRGGGPSASAGGGVRVCCRGEAVYDWN